MNRVRLLLLNSLGNTRGDNRRSARPTGVRPSNFVLRRHSSRPRANLLCRPQPRLGLILACCTLTNSILVPDPVQETGPTHQFALDTKHLRADTRGLHLPGLRPAFS